ncbi:MAG: hypothetical protein IJN53_00550 [Oscillospiraceae bacterium]|nr:hypothetical protein [Oscillospiraceae bacterium]
MIIRKQDFALDVDVEATSRYSQTHSLCDCSECRNLYAQIADKLPNLTAFLSELGLQIARPDETGSCAGEDHIDYNFVSYTVIGQILDSDKYEMDMVDGELPLKIVIDRSYIPNEQQTERYFTVTVYNIKLPWVLNEPFPQPKEPSILQRIKNMLLK